MSAETQKVPVEKVTVDSLRPLLENVNIVVKVLEVNIISSRRRADGTYSRMAEAKVGDVTGCILCTIRNGQVDVFQPGATINVQNGKIDMYKATMRLVIDKWGKAEKIDDAKFEVKLDFDLSAIEFELIMESDKKKEKAGSKDVIATST